MVNEVEEPPKRNGLLIAVRVLLTINFLRFALSFFPKFEGTADARGLADEIFRLRMGGFRIDLVWLVISTAVIAIAFVALIADNKTRSETRNDALMSLLWIVAFVVYIARILFTGILDFG